VYRVDLYVKKLEWSPTRALKAKEKSSWIIAKVVIGYGVIPKLKSQFKRGFTKVDVPRVGHLRDMWRDSTVSLNYIDQAEKIRKLLSCWKYCRLTLIGKITVLKSLAASQLVVLACTFTF